MSARVRAVALAALAFAVAGCYEEPEGERRTKEVIDDLVAREFGRATSRYRMYEEVILAAEAAPAWRRAADHSDATVREWALDALARIGDRADLGLLRNGLEDTVRSVRLAAVTGLVRMDPATAAEEFTARLQADAPEQVTLAAAGLVELDHRAAAPLLVARFGDASLPESTRAALTQPIAALGGADVVAPLVDAALDPTLGAQLRRLAADSAFAIEAQGVEAELERLLAADDEYVSALAATMLGR